MQFHVFVEAGTRGKTLCANMTDAQLLFQTAMDPLAV